MTTSKMIDTNEISKFPEEMNEQLLKVSTPQSKSSFQTFEKTLFREVAPLSSPNPPLYVRGLGGTTILVSLKNRWHNILIHMFGIGDRSTNEKKVINNILKHTCFNHQQKR